MRAPAGAVATQVRHDHPVAGGGERGREPVVDPLLAVAGEAVDEDERPALPQLPVGQLDAIRGLEVPDREIGSRRRHATTLGPVMWILIGDRRCQGPAPSTGPDTMALRPS